MAVITRSIAGLRNSSEGKPCEDCKDSVKMKDVVIMCVSDGHSEDGCYGYVGAKIATYSMCNNMQNLRSNFEDYKKFGEYLAQNRNAIITSFIRQWTLSVLKDYQQRDNNGDLSEDQLLNFINYIKKTNSATEAEPLIDATIEQSIKEITSKYATSIKLAVITEKMVFCLGIGVGDIIAMTGDMVEWLLPIEAHNAVPTKLLGTIALSKAKSNFTAKLTPITTKKRTKHLEDQDFNPEVIMVISDGCRNSYTSDQRFSKKMLCIANGFKERGVKTFSNKATTWMQELSDNSPQQDDISMCVYSKYQHRKT